MKPIFAFLLFAILMTAPGSKAETTVAVDDFRFTKTVDIQDQRLKLKGAGLLRYMVFIKAYAGALYLPDPAPSDPVLAPVAKRLELAYYHAIGSEDFAKATRAKIRDNIDADQAQKLRARIDRLAEMYRDVKPGDRYALTYLPGKGTRLSLNGEDLGLIPGDDFAGAVFSIWLGDYPIDEAFRDTLLGVS
ncbi:chalcone isomerase family protein [uncultured Desulfosarcina sp.]|uniref:chalcone isomerase family protein n=1 Tax=uncultured Desulfosarcina sp. TaxID=218289 RepID=UPI0029C76118|nr:chalcone isomerase family protein [uncultured Desulfosarcina sp.]